LDHLGDSLCGVLKLVKAEKYLGDLEVNT